MRFWETSPSGARRSVRRRSWVLAVLVAATTAVEAARPTGRISGTVADEKGDPVGGLELSFVPQMGSEGNAQMLKVGEKGTFRHSFFPAGQYRLEIESPEWSVKAMQYVLRDETGLELYRQQGQAHAKEGLAPFAIGARQQVELQVVVARKGAGDQAVGEPALAKSAETAKKLLELYQSGQVERVVSEADALLQRDPELGAAHYLRGLALLKLQRPEEAEASLRRALALSADPTGLEGALGTALLAQARALKEARGMEEARPLYEEAASLLQRELARTPDSVPLLTNYASALEWAGKDQELAIALERLVSLVPEDPAYRLRLANLYIEGGESERALELLLGAPAGDRDAAALVYNLAVKLFNAGKAQQAADVAKKGIEKHPEHPMLYRVLARSYISLGDRPAAIEALKKVISVAPGDPETKEDRELLAFLEKQGR